MCFVCVCFCVCMCFVCVCVLCVRVRVLVCWIPRLQQLSEIHSSQDCKVTQRNNNNNNNNNTQHAETTQKAACTHNQTDAPTYASHAECMLATNLSFVSVCCLSLVSALVSVGFVVFLCCVLLLFLFLYCCCCCCCCCCYAVLCCLGQSFQVHGIPDEHFALISFPGFAFNSKFVYIASGDCTYNHVTQATQSTQKQARNHTEATDKLNTRSTTRRGQARTRHGRCREAQ